MTKPNKTDAAAAAEKALEQDRRQRQEQAAAVIRRVCEKYRVTLVPAILLVGGQQQAQLQLVAQ